MYSIERQNKILEILKEKKTVSIEKLSSILYTSSSTVRRDLNKLEQRGLVVRTFGGVILNANPSNKEVPLLLRESQNIITKRSICQRATRLLKDNCTIYFDSSSTTLQITQFLNDFENLVIVTNGLSIANEIISTTKHEVYLPCGKIDSSTTSILGPLAFEDIASFHFSYTVISCAAIDLNFGISETSLEQAEIKRIACQNADKVILLVDSSKFNKKSNFKNNILSQIDYVITNGEIDPAYDNFFQKQDIKVFKV